MSLTRKLSSKSLIKQNTSQDLANSANQTITIDTFVASGAGPYSLTVSPGSVNNTQVYVNGVYQEKNNYTLSNNQITFSVAPPTGTSIEVVSGSSYNIGVPSDASVTAVKISSGTALAGTVLTANGSGGATFTNNLPTITRYISGSGSGVTGYTPPTNCKYIRVKMVGGGGGGASSSNGTPGGNTTFGTSLLTANGGSGATGSTGGAGGTVTVNSPAITVVAVSGGSGNKGAQNTQDANGSGGASAFGGNGGYTFAGATNTGGGGAGGVSGAFGGGGAGGYIEALIASPFTGAPYAWQVGIAGASGGGSSTAGGSGVIIIEEYYV